MLNLNISFANLAMWIIVGGVAGWLASLAVRGGGVRGGGVRGGGVRGGGVRGGGVRGGGLGLLGDIAVGIIGAFLGGLVLSRLLPGVYAITDGFSGFTLGSLIVAFVGAVILLLVVRLFTARRLHSTT
jgi:uncharacterized membrane protein YeaQ/YmgE (transglycosylase-associated protein family)